MKLHLGEDILVENLVSSCDVIVTSELATCLGGWLCVKTHAT